MSGSHASVHPAKVVILPTTTSVFDSIELTVGGETPNHAMPRFCTDRGTVGWTADFSVPITIKRWFQLRIDEFGIVDGRQTEVGSAARVDRYSISGRADSGERVCLRRFPDPRGGASAQNPTAWPSARRSLPAHQPSLMAWIAWPRPKLTLRFSARFTRWPRWARTS